MYNLLFYTTCAPKGLENLMPSPSDYLVAENTTFTAHPDRKTHINPDLKDYLVARYEPLENKLFILSSEIKHGLSAEDRRELRANAQFVGCASMSFWRWTTMKGGTVAVHVFDLGKPDEVLRDLDYDKKYKAYAKSQIKAYGEANAITTRNLDAWIDNYTKYGTGPTSVDAENRILNRRLKRALARVSGKGKAKPKEIPERRLLQELDNYILDFKGHIRTDITKRKQDNGIPYLYPREKPMYVPALPNAAEVYKEAYDAWQEEFDAVNTDPAKQRRMTCGLFKQTATLSSTHIKKTMYIQVKHLRTYVPNYKQDIRYTHSQSMKIHSSKGESSAYCAVFDMTKG